MTESKIDVRTMREQVLLEFEDNKEKNILEIKAALHNIEIGFIRTYLNQYLKDNKIEIVGVIGRHKIYKKVPPEDQIKIKYLKQLLFFVNKMFKDNLDFLMTSPAITSFIIENSSKFEEIEKELI